MLRSMFAAVSGLRAHQTMMDVVGDNIANINTPGFRASRTIFADTLAQVMRAGSQASPASGGVNPEQVGLGVRIAGTDIVDTQGAIQNTGRPTDVAIQGSGYFVVRAGAEQMYTRAGSFSFDDAGNLVDPSGAVVQGWLADQNGNVTTSGPVHDIQLPLGTSIPPKPTDKVVLGGNLSAATASGDSVTTAVDIIDSVGTSHRLTLEYDKTSTPDTWTLTVKDSTGAVVPTTQGAQTTTLTFDSTSGALTSPTASNYPQFTYTDKTTNASATFALDFGAGSANGLTQYGTETTATVVSQDGAPSGYLRSFAIADDGTISGVFSNGHNTVLGQIALATFTNPAGLMRAGNGHFSAAAGAGLPAIGTPNSGGRGGVAAGTLEMSNVDLGQEFTNLIIAQRGFEANSRMISASDELLQDLVNMKH